MLSPVVNSVITMADAGVTALVITAFIECSPPADRLTPADVVALKQHNVADEIVTILLKQGAEVRAREVRRRNEAVARALAAREARSGGMDPESYDYFQYYYLQLRAMASAYRTLAPYIGPWGFHPYGAHAGYGPRYRGYDRYR